MSNNMNEPAFPVWIEASKELPQHNETVLIKTNKDNVFGPNNELMQFHVATFKRGRTAQEVKRDGVISFADQDGNNLFPYRWDGDGPCDWFGQEVTHWMRIPMLAEAEKHK